MCFGSRTSKVLRPVELVDISPISDDPKVLMVFKDILRAVIDLGKEAFPLSSDDADLTYPRRNHPQYKFLTSVNTIAYEHLFSRFHPSLTKVKSDELNEEFSKRFRRGEAPFSIGKYGSDSHLRILYDGSQCLGR